MAIAFLIVLLIRGFGWGWDFDGMLWGLLVVFVLHDMNSRRGGPVIA